MRRFLLTATWLAAGLPLAAQECAPAPARNLLDVPYVLRPGTAVRLTSLDAYVPARADGCVPAPAIVWVHGGGWRAGDKSNGVRDKIAFAHALGAAFVSVNYRLSPDPPRLDAPARVKWPDHPRDVAAALAFVRARGGEVGIDPERLALLGHSAGAHLVADVATDPAFFAEHGFGLDAVRCTASLDTQAYDLLAAQAAWEEEGAVLYENAFGSDPELLRRASPQTHVAPGQGIAPMLVVFRGAAERQALQLGFAGALSAAGVPTTLLDATSLTHGEVSERIGQPGDTIMTPALARFFQSCLF